ncbi:MAG: carbamate kinase, partial [Actinomycetota bacterium]
LPSPRGATPGLAVVALGGNAITLETQAGTYAEMVDNCRDMARALWALIDDGWRVVITHGNGPQVGNLAIQSMRSVDEVPALPLHALDAMTQGLIGHLIELAIINEACGELPPIASVVTHVVVHEDDPAFGNPSKPIGPFYSLEEGTHLAALHGWQVVDDSSRGQRRVVASPRPLAILEVEALKRMVDAGILVIACGGGGIPISMDGQIQGREAVVDKDRSAAVLAAEMDADALILVTGVDSVMVDFGTPAAQVLAEASTERMRGLLEEGQFPPGSMGPKVEAAIAFAEHSGGTAVITSAAHLADALAPDASVGTRVVAMTPAMSHGRGSA